MIPTTDPLNYGNEPGKGPLRPGGQSGESPSTEKNLPSTMSKAAQRQRNALGIVRDLSAGPEKVKERGSAYLPIAPGEDTLNYGERLARSVFTNFFGHTVEGLTGFVFRRDPSLDEDVPAQIVAHWENIDNAGTHGDVFARELFSDALTAGHNAILVDFPKTSGTQSARDEIVTGEIRPYWVPIHKDNILSWRTANNNGRIILTQVVLYECGMVPDGEFGEKEQKRYRVLYNIDGVVGFRLLEVADDKRVIEVDAGTYPTQDEIPIAEVITSGKRSIFDSNPPLIDLAYLNIAHYQSQSDYRWCIHKTNVPILFGAGFNLAEGEELVVSANKGIMAPDPNAKLEFVAHDGAALGESRNELQDLKGDMATLGLAMLSPDKRAAETAEAKRIDKSTSDSSLAVAARGLQDAIERALGFHAKYMRLESGGSITINRDFENLSLTPQQISALSNMVAKGQITLETLWKMLAEGGVLPDDFNDIEEKAMLDAEAEMKRQQMLEDAALQDDSEVSGTERIAA